MIADFKPHPMELADFLPGEEVCLVIHPALADEESRVEAEFLKQRSYVRELRFNRVIKSEDYALSRDLSRRGQNGTQANREERERRLEFHSYAGYQAALGF